MFQGKSVAVVVPAHNEELLIGKVLETMPEFVDRIIVVDDKSADRTPEIVAQLKDRLGPRLQVIRHEKNTGVGGALATGYKAARDQNFDVTAVMNGDAQMDPVELDKIILPIVEGRADYAKGNRLVRSDAWAVIPRVRYIGSLGLSFLTKIASGYWYMADSQSGYTAISLPALKTINWDRVYRRYGVPNDILVKLNIYNYRVADVPIRPVYRVGEKSEINFKTIIFTLSLLLIRLFFHRMIQKYILRDTHPLVFFYLMSLVCLPVGATIMILNIIPGISITLGWHIVAVFLLISGLQFLFFAMWFDMDYNRHLKAEP